MTGVVIRPMVDGDAAAVLAIYAAGIAAGDATFETEAPSWAAFDAGRLRAHRFVAVGPGSWFPRTPDAVRDLSPQQRDHGNGSVLGWAAVAPVSTRAVYAGVVEHSVYVHPDAQGERIGTALLRALIASTEAAGIWTVQSGIFPENVASVALHERLGFRVVGRRVRLGRQQGRWRDVLLVERRSPAID